MPKRRYRLLIAEDEIETQKVLSAYFSDDDTVECCGCAGSGSAAIEMIKKKKPDVLLLDLILPDRDGFAVLQEIQALPLAQRPHVLITSAVGTEATAREAMRMGAEYFFVKPYDLDDVHQRVCKVCQQPVQNPYAMRKSAVIRQIINLGIPTNIAGYNYTVDAVCFLLGSDRMCSMKKDVYAAVAEHNQTTTQCVENALHTVIGHMYAANTPALQAILATQGERAAQKMTNAQFITLLAGILRMQEVW